MGIHDLHKKIIVTTAFTTKLKEKHNKTKLTFPPYKPSTLNLDFKPHALTS
jgi:hypothetical protein